ncbi:hypothetical protein Aduo_004720 [Ancylostoma duodenale]
MTTGAVGQLSRTQRISLRLWVFKFIDVEDIESFGVCVEGYRPNDDTETVLRNWHSTAITKRITPTLLHSCSGSVYELRGSIDRELARQYGYPPELTELFLNGFPENWKSILKEYFYVVKTTNPMNASHYFSSIARRRSLNTVRGCSLLSASSDSNRSNRRSERLSILPAPATLPVPIAEEIEADEGEKENSVLNSSSASAKKVKNAESATSNVSPLPSPAENNQTPKLNDGVSRFGTRRSPRIREILSRSGSKDVKNAESATSNVSPLPSPALNNKSKVSAKDACETNECQSSANGMPGNVLEESTASSESSYIFVPRLNSETSQTLDQLPIVQSPGSIASSSISAGPVFEEPHCSGEISTRESSERANDDSARDLALVPVEPVFKVPSRRPSKGNHDDAVELSEWSIRFALGLDGPELGFPKFVLLGNRKGHVNQWRTSIIVRVESSEILHTSSTKYRLVGDMDIIDSASAGFPKMFVAKFVRGFPPDWRTRITELYNTFFANLGTHNGVDSHSETRQPLLFSEDSEESDSRDRFQVSHYARDGQTSRAGCSKNSDTLSYSSARGRNARIDSSSSGCPDEPYVRDANNSAVVRHRNSASGPEIRRSRSGRCVHAPLAQWAGERVRYDGFGNVIGVQGVNTETMHSKGAVGALALSNYYGVSPARPARQSEAFLQVPELAVDHGPKTVKRRKALVTYSDSSDEGEEQFTRRRARYLSDEESPVPKRSRRRAYHTDSEEYEIERELNAERRLLLEQAKELRRQQENLIEMERRLAYHEAKWRKRRAKERRFESENRSGRYSPERMVEETNHHRRQQKAGKQHMPKKPSRHEAEEDRCWREDMLEVQRPEDEWARENAQLSESDYSDGDSDWHEPVRKRRKKQFRRVRKQSSSEDSSTGDDEDEEEESSETELNGDPRSNKPAAKKEKGWNRAELERLKLALAAIIVRTDDDWEKVARSLGNGRDPESCKQAAIKRLKWEPLAEESPGPVKVSEVVTARAGTVAFQHHTNEYTRKFMLGGGGQCEDFFKNNETNMNDSLAIPDVTEFGADDSLLEAMRTPAAVLAERKRANRRQFLAEAEDDDDTPIRRRSSLIPLGTPVDSAQRERQDRYFHHLISKGGRRDMFGMNFSRVTNSTRFETTKVGRGSNKAQNYGSLHEDLNYAAKMTRKASRKNAVLEEDSDRDLELEDDMEENDDDVF